MVEAIVPKCQHNHQYQPTVARSPLPSQTCSSKMRSSMVPTVMKRTAFTCSAANQ